jgi:sterol 14alpha-demethylase
MIEEEVENFMDTDPAFRTWQSGDVKTWDSIDVPKVFSEITILTASRTLQGKEVRGSIDKSFAEVYSDLDGGFTPLNFMFPNLPLESYRKRDRAQKKMSDFYVDIIKRRRTNPQEGAHDMIAALMDKKYRNGIALKDHQIAHLMIALLMAGQHTSAATSTWAFLHLAQSPDTVLVYLA